MKRIINTYELYCDFCVGYDYLGREFYFDIEDFEKIKQWSWSVCKDGRVCGFKDGKRLRMHKLITGTSAEVIDHIDNNPQNNQKSNLRLSDKQKNNINRKHNKNNIVGVKGVSKTKNGLYFSRIMVNGTSKYLGCFSSLEDAKLAREKAEKNIFGEFAFSG